MIGMVEKVDRVLGRKALRTHRTLESLEILSSVQIQFHFKSYNVKVKSNGCFDKICGKQATKQIPLGPQDP